MRKTGLGKPGAQTGFSKKRICLGKDFLNMIAIYKANLQIAIAKKKQRGWMRGVRRVQEQKKNHMTGKERPEPYIYKGKEDRPPSGSRNGKPIGTGLAN